MKKWTGLILLAAGLIILVCCSGCQDQEDPAARVNDQFISKGELQRFINLMRLCNPESNLPWKEHRESELRSQMEKEVLQILIGFELVNQAAAKASVNIDPEELDSKTGAWLQNLVETHYAGSLDQFHRQRKKLGLLPADLALFPRYELQAGALINRVAATLKDDDLLIFVEENPGILLQPAAAKLYRFCFTDEQAVQRALSELRRGVAIEKAASVRTADCRDLGWISADDPFQENIVRQELLLHPETGKSCLTHSADQYCLYWTGAVRPEQRISFAEIKNEAAWLKKSLLYSDFFDTLWREGRVKIYLR